MKYYRKNIIVKKKKKTNKMHYNIIKPDWNINQFRKLPS